MLRAGASGSCMDRQRARCERGETENRRQAASRIFPLSPTPLLLQGYGNGALALLFTVAGNITGIVTAPLMVKAVLGSLTNAKIDSLDLLVKLGVSILMPVLVGKATREAVPLIRRAAHGLAGSGLTLFLGAGGGGAGTTACP